MNFTRWRSGRKLYRTIDEIKADIDEFMAYYNNQRTNQGRYYQGRTHMQTFNDGRELYQKYVHDAVDAAAVAV